MCSVGDYIVCNVCYLLIIIITTVTTITSVCVVLWFAWDMFQLWVENETCWGLVPLLFAVVAYNPCWADLLLYMVIYITDLPIIAI